MMVRLKQDLTMTMTIEILNIDELINIDEELCYYCDNITYDGIHLTCKKDKYIPHEWVLFCTGFKRKQEDIQ